MTFSASVVEALNNGPPKATISFEGPVAGNAEVLKKVDDAGGGYEYESTPGSNSKTPSLGRELRTGTEKNWPVVKDSDKNVRYDLRMGIINRSLKVDWTHAGESEDSVAARAQIELDKKEAYRNYGRGAPPRGEAEEQSAKERGEKFKAITKVRIEPFEETNSIRATGWYRLCVSSEYHALMVEMDMRSGKKMGGVDRKTGHVYTHEAKEMLDAEKFIDEDITAEEERQLDANTYASLNEEQQKEIENQVREQDLHATKSQIKHLNSMVIEMKKKHQDSHNRVKSHKATARRSYESLVWCSKLETLLYILITGVQVYTVRKWLLGNSLLGS